MLADLPNDHQQADMEIALRHVDRFVSALDCGAHRGIITRQLVKRFQSVTAIEPSELADQIKDATVIKAAIGDKAGRCSMKHGTENTGQRHVVSGDDTEVITIDSLGLAPDFIKLDVEGMEYLALKGGEETIKRCKPVIMLEENGLNQRYGIPDNAACELLESWGAVRVAILNKDHVFKWPR